MKIGLFFGSFNPVHVGHLLIAGCMHDLAVLDEIWFVVSPQNPFKTNDDLASEQQRILWLEKAIQGDSRFKTCDVEFNLPRPSYTVHTMQQLRAQYPEHEFKVIIGGDNFSGFERWKDWNDILDHHELYVYRRPGYPDNEKLKGHDRIRLFDVPLLNISSTFVRDRIRQGMSVRYLVPDSVRSEIIAFFSA